MMIDTHEFALSGHDSRFVFNAQLPTYGGLVGSIFECFYHVHPHHVFSLYTSRYDIFINLMCVSRRITL